MKSILVKIDQNTIRKNPNAGQTSFSTAGPTEITFSYTGDEPKLLKNCIITSTDSLGRIEGLIDNPKHAAELESIKGMSITYQNSRQIHHHAPNPKWLYKYENPNVKCSNCKKLVPLIEIIIESNEDLAWKICPICDEINTFPEIEYEDINKVVKQLKLE